MYPGNLILEVFYEKVSKKKSTTASKEDRKSFRIEYPPSYRPQFIHIIGKFPVLDLSEGGLRFEVDPEHTFMETEKVRAILKLVSDNEVEIRGRVVRVHGRQITFQFIDEFPMAVLVEEERFLAQRKLLRVN